MIGLVLSCEHASWQLPPGVDLGVDPELLQTQAGWDHGAFEIAAQLGDGLGLDVHAGLFTRTFVDLNRPATSAEVVPSTCYGLHVPGNQRLTSAERDARIASYHTPYWNAVRLEVRARLRDPGRCLHLSIHSFSPELEPIERTFDVGVLYDPASLFETHLAERLYFGLRAAGLEVRRNEPYSGVAPALSTSLRGELRGQGTGGNGYAGIEIEASHALTQAPGGCARIATALLPLVEAIRDQP